MMELRKISAVELPDSSVSRLVAAVAVFRFFVVSIFVDFPEVTRPLDVVDVVVKSPNAAVVVSKSTSVVSAAGRLDEIASD